MKYAKRMQSLNVDYFGIEGHQELLNRVEAAPPTEPIFVFYFSGFVNDNSQSNINLLVELVKAGEKCYFFDTSLTDTIDIAEISFIVKYRGGKMFTTNYLEHYNYKLRNSCVAKPKLGSTGN